MTPRVRPPISRPGFTTPFKAGMRPGESGRVEADLLKQKQKADLALAAEKERRAAELKEMERKRAVFDLSAFVKMFAFGELY